MKKLTLLLIILLWISGLNAQTDDYYWYNDDQIFLETYHKKKYIVVDSTITSESELIDALDDPSLSVIYFTQTNTLNTINVYDSTATEKQYAIIESQDSIDESALENNHIINYIGPYYIRQISWEPVIKRLYGVTRMFHVRLNEQNDIVLLDSMANAHSVNILGNNIYMPLIYTLECTNQSTGNALEMANLFYEINLYDFSEPNFIVEDFYDVENYKQKEFKVYPNPTKDYLHIEKSNTDVNITEISIYDISGNLVKSYSNDSKRLSLINLSSGLYILRIETKKQSLKYKIMHY
jgi:hypothetical protein